VPSFTNERVAGEGNEVQTTAWLLGFHTAWLALVALPVPVNSGPTSTEVIGTDVAGTAVACARTSNPSGINDNTIATTSNNGKRLYSLYSLYINIPSIMLTFNNPTPPEASMSMDFRQNAGKLHGNSRQCAMHIQLGRVATTEMVQFLWQFWVKGLFSIRVIMLQGLFLNRWIFFASNKNIQKTAALRDSLNKGVSRFFT